MSRILSLFYSKRLQLVLLFLGFLIYHFVVQKAGFTFPFPWADEESYIWPGIDFAKTNSLFSLVMNPDRSTFWIPPGLQILSGLIYKIIPFTFEFGRRLSEFYLLGAMICFFFLVRPYIDSLVAVVFCILFLFSGEMIVTGNNIRFEALILLIASASYLLYDRKYRVAGLSLGLLAPLVHPNGVNFWGALCFFALIEYCLYGRKAEERRILRSRWEMLLLGIALGCWVGYAMYAALNWHYFWRDWAFQLQFKKTLYIPMWKNLRSFSYLFTAIVGMLTLARWKRGSAILIVFLIASASVFRIAQVMWYLPYDRMAYLVCTLVWFEIGKSCFLRIAPRLKVASWVYAPVMVAVLIAGDVAARSITMPFVNLRDIEWCGMNFRDKWPITTEEIEFVGGYLKTLEQPNKTVLVQFNISTLFFANYFTERVTGYIALFYFKPPDRRIFVHPTSRIDLLPPPPNGDFYDYLVKNGLVDKYLIHRSSKGNLWFDIPIELFRKINPSPPSWELGEQDYRKRGLMD